MWALSRQGWPRERIGSQLGLSRSTVYRCLRSEVFLERRTRRDAGHSRLDPWRSVVLDHWNDGRRNGRTLLRDLQRRGYRGSYATLTRYLRRFRTLPRDAASARSPPVLVAVAPGRELTPRRAAWTVLRKEERRSAQDSEVLADLRRCAPELDEAVNRPGFPGGRFV